MIIVLMHNHYDAERLACVTEQMRTMGAPTIKAVWLECYGVWAALEGCHRIRAAKELSLTPRIKEIAWSDELRLSDISALDGDDDYVISEICADAWSNTQVRFDASANP